MNDLIINIRLFRWHLQVRENFMPRIVRNDFHAGRRPWFKVYQFGDHFYE